MGTGISPTVTLELLESLLTCLGLHIGPAAFESPLQVCELKSSLSKSPDSSRFLPTGLAA